MDTCEYCKEPIDDEGDRYIPLDTSGLGGWSPFQGTILQATLHRTCFLRQIVGSVAHQERRCHCYDRSSEADDPPGMTRREGARAAVELFERTNGGN